MTVENTQTDTAATPDRGDDYTPPTTEAVEVEVEAAAEEKAPEADEKVEGKAAPEKAADEEPDPTKAAKTDAEEEDPPRDEKGKFKGKEPLIPKSRFDQAGKRSAAKIEALSSRLAAVEAELTATMSGNSTELETLLDDKSAEYTKLVADGETDKANAVMKEINRINRKLAAAEAVAISKSTTAAGHATMAFQDLVAHYEAEYPELDQANDDSNQDAIKWVNARVGVFIKAGMSESAALRDAMDDAVARFGLKGASEAEEPEAKPDKNAERKAAAVAKNVATAGKQPAKLDSVGKDSDKAGATKVIPSSLSMAEFEKLPETVRARLRGDLI